MALIDDFSITLNYNCLIVFTFLDTILSSIYAVIIMGQNLRTMLILVLLFSPKR
ncbi:hypothetical protein RhiirA4_407929, partial [Rhizophagus irregularis]